MQSRVEEEKTRTSGCWRVGFWKTEPKLKNLASAAEKERKTFKKLKEMGTRYYGGRRWKRD